MAALRLRHVIVFAAILHMLVGLAWGRFVVQKNSLRITVPDSLQDTYDSAIADFGIPQYGGTMMGIIVYEREFAKACDPFTSSFDLSVSYIGRSPVFLVDRGDCFFALKVYHAQLAGAAAVLIADDREEELIVMDCPWADYSERGVGYVEKITIPSALITKDLGDRMKKSVDVSDLIHINLDWTESLPHPDDRVEYEFWTNSDDMCGPKCDARVDFVKNFKGAAQLLERGGYTLFTPHYITWYCPTPFIHSKQCLSQCINHGRYCAPDTEPNFVRGYEGKDVVVENLRQLCVFEVSKKAKRPWVWWDYVTDLQIRCPTIDPKYRGVCAEAVIQSLSLSVEDVKECMGDPTADSANPILKAEQDKQQGKGKRGYVTMLPTLMINNGQYRGMLDKGGVMKAICAGFKEATDPPPCMSEELETNECLDNNGGCWKSTTANVTACQDTSRGRVCECPVVQGVQFVGDGYQTCEPTGPGRYKIWVNAASRVGWWISLVHHIGWVVAIALGGYMVYKYRLQSHMDSEVRAIMAQYMPLDSQAEMGQEDKTVP